jgi:hypothetical protein
MHICRYGCMCWYYTHRYNLVTIGFYVCMYLSACQIMTISLPLACMFACVNMPNILAVISDERTNERMNDCMYVCIAMPNTAFRHQLR